jgi:hypothetical protein
MTQHREVSKAGLTFRAKAALLTMPSYPRWAPSAGYPQAVLDELQSAGIIEIGQVIGRPPILRVTELGQSLTNELVSEGF